MNYSALPRAFLPLPLLLASLLAPAPLPAADPAEAEVRQATVTGGFLDGKARLVIEALLANPSHRPQPLIHTLALEHAVQVSPERIQHTFHATLEYLHGDPKEIPLSLLGPGTIDHVTGEGLLDWSVRLNAQGTRTLILRPSPADPAPPRLAVRIEATQPVESLDNPTSLLTLTPTHPALAHGYLSISAAPELVLQASSLSGLQPIDPQFLPEPLRTPSTTPTVDPLGFRFQGTAYSLSISPSLADPDHRRIVLRDFSLQGQLAGGQAAFTLSATARVRAPQGGTLPLLTGGIALTSIDTPPGCQLKFENDHYVLHAAQAGEFPLRLAFRAAVKQTNNWNVLSFRVAPSPVQPVLLQGLAADTQFQFAGAARPERHGSNYVSHLPPDGHVNLSWKEARPETEGRLFYAAELLAQVSVSPGLLRQTALLQCTIMQGELHRLQLLLAGPGEVTRVQGDHILAWSVTPAPNSPHRLLTVQFNQARKEPFPLLVQIQSPLGAFPQTADVPRLQTLDASRFAGHVRIVNDGAVRLEVLASPGLSQVSPDQFPESDLTRSSMPPTGLQRFVFRFSGLEHALRIQADNILPELAVSQVLAFHLAETELTLDAELDLDIREAPIRELYLRVPRGYALARLNAPGLNDFFLREPEGEPDAELRLVYGQPATGRQLVQLRLEHNHPLADTNWTLPHLEVVKAKSTRGYLGISADPGFRLTPDRTQHLTEIATAFFQRKSPGLQAAFRLSDPAWQATLRVERLPQSIQADAFHLFSIAEGIAYGSSVLNYAISGAPVSTFQIELSPEYFNVEFTGRDVRHWQKNDSGYLVQLHSPVSGPYTLLATYERPFQAKGDTLTFTGARPADAQNEQGHTVVISAYQFQVRPAQVSTNLLLLEPAELPAEYRLLFDAPILAAYRYNSRPYNLQLALSPLAQSESLAQVVDRASLHTRISKEGQIVTDATYYIKNRGQPHFRITLPQGVELWSATVDGAVAVPVRDTQAHLIPIPQKADPNAILRLDLKLAARPSKPSRLTVAAPIVAAPVMLAEWRLHPDAGQRLAWKRGTLTPPGGIVDVSGFAGLARMFQTTADRASLPPLVTSLALVLVALLLWRWTAAPGVYRFSPRHLAGAAVGLVAVLFAALGFAILIQQANSVASSLPADLTLLAPVQQAGDPLSVEIANLPLKASPLSFLAYVWPVILALGLWGFSWLTPQTPSQPVYHLLAWTLCAWAALSAPNGAPAFFAILGLFLLLTLLLPAFRALCRLPLPPPTSPAPPPATSGTSPALTTSLLLLSLIPSLTTLQGAPLHHPPAPPFASSVTQQVRIEDNAAHGEARFTWSAQKGQMLPILFEPAVLTSISFPTNALKLIEAPSGPRRARQLLALESGTYTINLQYQTLVNPAGIQPPEGESGFILPTQFGLVNRVELTLPNLDVEVHSPHAISIDPSPTPTNATHTSVTLALSPTTDAWIAWKPRSRDVRREKALFYTEIAHLLIPAPGVIEAAHAVAIRPAQGQLDELTFDTPSGATITDVADEASPTAISLWRFDPDARKLRVTLSPPQSRPFTLLIRSQFATGPLPLSHQLGLLSTPQSAGEVGLVGIATSGEVQLDNVVPQALSPINLEDFPAALLVPLQTRLPGLTLRRAYRYAEPHPNATLQASAVEPDVRVESQTTLSLGEDRTVLVANLTVEITRAGLFRLSFPLPTNLDVETVSGEALSHWTDLQQDNLRIVTLHLKSRTEGRQTFNLTLTGPGVKATPAWNVPQLTLREASKHTGTLAIVPEQGMRLQIASRSGLTPLDPQKSDLRQKGVLAFRILQSPWQLALDLETVAPWIQVASLQQFTVGEALLKVAAHLHYQIENTGLKSFRLLLPTNAENVRLTGDQVADFLPLPQTATNGLQEWEIKLHRRVIGRYLLQAHYQTLVPPDLQQLHAHGLQTLGVNLQRGFVTVQPSGRLQVRLDQPSAALQPADWQSIPRSLLPDPAAPPTQLAFRLVEPAFTATLHLERHQAARLLPARVNQITLRSVIADDGAMLTQILLELLPGDKRLLPLRLPPEARFWFAFVNQNGVLPWREQDRILLPIDPSSRPGQPITVEIFFGSKPGQVTSRSLNLRLLAPQFDLPLENIRWLVYLNDSWRLHRWTGSLQLQEDHPTPVPATLDVQTYLQSEATLQQAKTRSAEELLATGNQFLEQGNPQQARRAFQAAFGLSQHDNAFNEDARVQLHNLKLEQALVGLNARQAALEGESSTLNAQFRELRARQNLNYTPQEYQEILGRNTADDNAAFKKLAERLIQQQDAAVTTPGAIRASVPEQGRLLQFTRTVQVDPTSKLELNLHAAAVRTAPTPFRLAILAAVFLAFALLRSLRPSLRPSPQKPAPTT